MRERPGPTGPPGCRRRYSSHTPRAARPPLPRAASPGMIQRVAALAAAGVAGWPGFPVTAGAGAAGWPTAGWVAGGWVAVRVVAGGATGAGPPAGVATWVEPSE
jgi:hypothetical protein